MHVVLAVTGGVAAYKTPRIVSLLTESGHEVQVMGTPHGMEFVSPLVLAALSGRPVLTEMFDGSGDYQIHHIKLPEWADLLLVAPATANILAKAAWGLADDLVSTTLLAAGTGADQVCQCVFAPSMNPRMWRHAATQANLNLLRERGCAILEPDTGKLACADQGTGRMPEPEAIVSQLVSRGLLSAPTGIA